MNNQDRNQLKNSNYKNIIHSSSPLFGPFFMFSSSYFSLRHDKPLSWVVLRGGEVCSVGPGFTSLSLSHLAITSITQQNHNTTHRFAPFPRKKRALVSSFNKPTHCAENIFLPQIFMSIVSMILLLLFSRKSCFVPKVTMINFQFPDGYKLKFFLEYDLTKNICLAITP